MSEAAALKVAIDLVHVPSRLRHVRANPLPDGVLMVLRVAAGDEKATDRAVELTLRPREVVREAAAFFLEQVLLSPESDSYRVLGAGPEATAAELRRNMALLQMFLHPDLQHREERSVFSRRVSAAWEDLKTPARRAGYDEALRGSRRKRAPSGGRKALAYRRRSMSPALDHRHKGVVTLPSLYLYREPQVCLLRRALLFLFGGVWS
jgi:hypothetical protein